MRTAFWASRHARSVLFLLAALAIAGVFAGMTLPVSLFPKVNFPRVRVDLEAGERPAERMLVEVTRPVEEEVRSIPGVRSVESTTSRGSAQVLLTFDWGADITSDMLQVEGQVNKIITELPAGTTFNVRRLDPSFLPVISYSITSDTHSLAELYDLAQYQLRPLLSTVPGVANVGVTGGNVEEYRVVLDLAKLRSHELAPSDVTTALSAANVLTAVGRLEDRDKLYLVVTDTRFKNIDELASTILRSGPGGGVIRLRDVAQVRRDVEPKYTRSTADGHQAVLFDVLQQPGGNTVEVARGIRQMLASEQKKLPSDIKIANWYDQSDLIVASAKSVRDAVIIGVCLAALVLLLFLRDWKMTLIAAIAVPVVLAVTTLLLYALGQSFNIMTLGGMAAAVGLIIDDAIVMSEHIVRRLRAARGADSKAAVLHATDEFTRPLTGSSLSTIIIHIPPAFMIGVAGAFFASLSLSMASSLIISFFVAWLAIPVLAAAWLRARDADRLEGGELTRQVHSAYGAIMRRLLPYSFLVLLVIVPIFVLGYIAYGHEKTDLLPKIDEGGFIIDYKAPPGTSVTETDRLCRQIEDILRGIPEVQTYSRRTGYNFGAVELSESNTGDFFVRLKRLPRRSTDQVQSEVEEKIAKQVPGMDIETAQLMEDMIGDLTGRPEPVVVNLFSDDQAVLNDLAPKVASALQKVNGVKEIRSGIVPAGDALDIQVDRVMAALEGVDPEMVTKSLTDLLTGSVTTQIEQGPKLIGVHVWIPAGDRRTILDVSNLQIRAPDGHLFPLKRVATLSTISGQPEIRRQDLKRMVSVTARSDRDLGSTIRDVQQVLDQPGLLPSGIRYTLGGLYEQQQIAFHGMLRVICTAAALVFLLLLFLYESFRVAIAILLTTALAIASVMLALWLTDTALNISALMGIVMIVGNVTEVAIFFYSEYVQAQLGTHSYERLIAAGTYRMRAIVMSSLAAILALLPLALGIGQGSGMLQPLAIAIIAGLVVQLPLVLLVFPALLALFGTTRQRVYPADSRPA